MQNISLVSIIESYKDIPPIYLGSTRLLRWSSTSSSGMSSSFQLTDASLAEPHPFKGLRATKASKSEGQRLFCTLNITDIHTGEVKDVYTGEAILVWWAEDCSEGMKITIKFREGPDGVTNGVHPCFEFEASKKNGQIMSASIWMIDEDELPSIPAEKKKKFSELSSTVQSHILSRDQNFANWLRNNLSAYVPIEMQGEISEISDDTIFVGNIIKIYCGILSRADFNRDDDVAVTANKKWKQLLYSYNSHRWKKNF